eukprot:CAMPEP_0169267930 /NCGR_PEP_ID=MMETSP1016-20121227/47461_1 /TAXON_ID=342587 /ORGANISM="Karlodinium micrum, Strain CCMP2283" /LENGTH=458 /DNA_ID=CAMNT_0009352471 /DNA_START=11 /DNA_END=1387 /DNA_ORIENTATION=-
MRSKQHLPVDRNVYGQCLWKGPAGGSKFVVAFPKKNCPLMCKGSLYELESKVMPYFLERTKFHGTKCFCYTLQEISPVFAFNTKQSNCNPSNCWEKLKRMLNFEVPADKHIDVNNMENFESSCEPCSSLETCPEKLTLPDFLMSAGGKDEVEVVEARTKFQEALVAEGITLHPVAPEKVDVVASDQDEFVVVENMITNGVTPDVAKVWVKAPAISSSSNSSGDIEASTEIQVVQEVKDVVNDSSLTLNVVEENVSPCSNLFPSQCKVQAGPDGDEWLETAKEQSCVGNELVLQVHPDYPESLIAIRVLSTDEVARHGHKDGEEFGYIDVAHNMLEEHLGDDTWPFPPFFNLESKKVKGGSTPYVAVWHSKTSVKLKLLGKNGQSISLGGTQELRLVYYPQEPNSVFFTSLPAPTVHKTAATGLFGHLQSLLMFPEDVTVVQHPKVEGVLPVLPPECVQ